MHIPVSKSDGSRMKWKHQFLALSTEPKRSNTGVFLEDGAQLMICVKEQKQAKSTASSGTSILPVSSKRVP